MNHDFLEKKHKSVLLGLSGGVDSTAATLLLKQQGYEVTGMFFDVLGNQEEARMKAQKTAEELEIPLICRDVSESFSKEVIDYFCYSYLTGQTPNPCVKCNPTIKFKTMEDVADHIGAEHLATGHYARIFYDQPADTYFIQKGVNEKKDQSYMLYRLSQKILKRLILPLGEMMDKADVRDMVRYHEIGNADTKDSQEICFIRDENYIQFVENRIAATDCDQEKNQHGLFVDKYGNQLGEHRGILRYTVGQRKGLGMTFGKPMFVIAMNAKDHTITLGDHEDLFSHQVVSEDNFFVIQDAKGGSAADFPSIYEGKEITAKIRYAAKPAAATLHDLGDGKVATLFAEKQRAATPGQSIVFYDHDLVIGGGIIC